MDLLLRSVTADDLPIFFAQQLDLQAIHMAAFTSKDPADRAAFMARWERILAEPAILVRTIVCVEQVAGHVMSYENEGKVEVTYWLGREFWGRGLASQTLSEFLIGVNQVRPIYARAAKDNAASLRVLQKCGFKIVGEDRGYANARQMEIEEWLLSLES